MNKSELINRITESNDIASKAEATRTLDMILEIITNEVANGNHVALSQSFGTFKPATQAAKPARAGRNPSTGAAMQIPATPAKQVIRFSPSAGLKRAIAGTK